MKFTKNKGMSLIVVFIVLVLFNVIAFVIPFNREAGFWTGYAFISLAIILTAGVGLYAFGHEGLKSKYYGVPIVSVVWIYLIVQFIVGLFEMAVSAIPFRYEIAFNVILLGITLIGLIGVNMGKEEIERIDKKIAEKTFYIKSLYADVEGYSNLATDPALKVQLKDLAEAIRFSDPMSNPQLAAIENNIEAKAIALGNSLNANDGKASDLISELQHLIAQRNIKCKMLK